MSEAPSSREDSAHALPFPLRGRNRQSAIGNRQSLAFLLLLLGSVGLRMVALDRPLVDAHNTRQCQTAILTKNMMAEGGLPLSAHADWKGDEPGRLFLEMPLYNWAALGVAHLVGDLDMAGKLVSIAFWALAFWLNHLLMRRVLTPAQARWGDLLFALSPLSIFFGQAFQPEMLIMVLALGLVLSFLQHQQTGSMAWFAVCVALSLVAVTVKANEVSHLFLLIALLAFAREGWTCVLRPRYWTFMILLALTTRFYGAYMTEVNSAAFPEWTTGGLLAGFSGGKGARLSLQPYLRIAGYVGTLLVTPAAGVIALIGLIRIFRRRVPQLYVLWTVSLALFYLFWGPGTSFVHSYYNLPSLPVACALFGCGATATVARLRVRTGARSHAPSLATATIVGLLLAGSVCGSIILFWPDRVAWNGAVALRRVTANRKGFLFCYPNHVAYGPGYVHYTTLFYYSDLQGWNENPKWTPQQRQEVLNKCRWAVELRYNPAHQISLREKTFFTNKPRRLLKTDILQARGDFILAEETADYRIWEKRPHTPR